MRIDHLLAELALLAHVGPRVAAVPGALAWSAAEGTVRSMSALVWSLLENRE